MRRILEFRTLKLQILIFYLICSFSYAQNSKLDSAYSYYKKAQLFDINNKHFKAYNYYKKSLDLYSSLGFIDSIANCNISLFDLITSQNNLEYNSKTYLDDFYKYAVFKKDTFFLLKASNRYAQYFWDSENINTSRKYYKKSLIYTNNSKLKKYKPNIYSNLAHLYSKKIPDSAIYFFDKALNELDKKQNNRFIETYINYANFFQKQKKYKKAIEQLIKAKEIKPTAYELKYNKIIFGKFANCYKELGNFKMAYIYYEKYNIARDSLNNTQQNIAISDLDKKYKTAEKDKKIIESEAKRKQNRNLLIGSIILTFLGSIIGFLTLKNTKRKQKLAEQQKELETQKNLTLLKEQEITTINAMVEGQEKERKRVAEDLHDNLGSVLATLKLHFENLKLNREKKKIDQNQLFNKTENLIDEAYLKVRSIAHAKNAGVIANQGLLTAIKVMSEKISSADKLKIDVVSYGLDNRLDNSLEINVFRIIQELVTNIIKHANASNATINVSQYENNLNIIIEDDGVGFNINSVNLKNGMGLSSIKTRIEHLNGSFNVDSTHKKGSSVIIDIPIT